MCLYENEADECFALEINLGGKFVDIRGLCPRFARRLVPLGTSLSSHRL